MGVAEQLARTTADDDLIGYPRPAEWILGVLRINGQAPRLTRRRGRKGELNSIVRRIYYQEEAIIDDSAPLFIYDFEGGGSRNTIRVKNAHKTVEIVSHPLSEIEQFVAPTRCKIDLRRRIGLCKNPANATSVFTGSCVVAGGDAAGLESTR